MTSWDVSTGSLGAKLRLTVTQNSQSVEDNTSSVTATLSAVDVPSATFTDQGSATIQGVGATVSADIDWSAGHTSGTLATVTRTVTHNADGTLTLSVTGKIVGSTGTSGLGGPTTNGPRTFVLDTIPRATVPTLANSSRQVGQSTTITLDRASDSFTHDITYAFGSLTGQTSGLSASTGVATSATFTVPTSLVSEMVGQSSKTLTFTVVTKSGSTVIGSKTVQLTITPAGGTVYQRPTVAAAVVRALSDGTADDDGTCAKVSITAAVTSVLVSTEQNTLTWKVEVSADSGDTWGQLGTGTVDSHGLTLSSATTYTDSDPSTGGTQAFATTSGFLFRVTITDAFSNAAVQIVAMTTAAAILDVYSEEGQPVGLGIGALYNPAVTSRIQIDGEPALTPAGVVSQFAGASAPTGWLLCDGSAVSRTTYADLFDAIGTTYGAGNGSTTFNVPDLKGRVPVGRDAGQSEFDTLGETGGAKTHAHDLSDDGFAQIAIASPVGSAGLHNNRVSASGAFTSNSRVGSSIVDTTARSIDFVTPLGGTTDAATGLPPYLVMNFIIKT